MINRSFLVILLFACTVLLTVPANAQLFVSSHTNINSDRRIVPTCQTLMQDADTIRLYPDAAVICTVVQDGIAIQTLPVCSGNPSAICTVQTGIAVVIEGADYKATAEHDLVLNVKPSGCIQNGVLVVCYSDPMGYVVPAGPIPANRQFTDLGQVTPSGVAAIWIPSIPGDNSFFMATSAETQFQTAQVLPFVLHAKAGDKRDFTLNGNQNANWTFTGVAGTTVPIAPSQGTSITFQAPSTVPVQQQDTLTACKVDTSHGTVCNSAQIIVECSRSASTLPTRLATRLSTRTNCLAVRLLNTKRRWFRADKLSICRSTGYLANPLA
jgi:hypothetical protein